MSSHLEGMRILLTARHKHVFAKGTDKRLILRLAPPYVISQLFQFSLWSNTHKTHHQVLVCIMRTKHSISHLFILCDIQCIFMCIFCRLCVYVNIEYGLCDMSPYTNNKITRRYALSAQKSEQSLAGVESVAQLVVAPVHPSSFGQRHKWCVG